MRSRCVLDDLDARLHAANPIDFGASFRSAILATNDFFRFFFGRVSFAHAARSVGSNASLFMPDRCARINLLDVNILNVNRKIVDHRPFGFCSSGDLSIGYPGELFIFVS